jgi:hypothetical protein
MDKDKEYKRFLVACFAMNGLITRYGLDGVRELSDASFRIADAMIDQEDSENVVDSGIVAAKPKRSTRKRI